MATTIDTAKVLSLLHDAVKLKGADYKYNTDETCVYKNPDGTPSCIVGHVFSSLGLEIPEQYNTNSIRFLSSSHYDHDRAYITIPTVSREVEFTVGAFEALEQAQLKQDAGVAWGEAVEYAEMSVEKNIPEEKR
jgi:hypothetical protein